MKLIIKRSEWARGPDRDNYLFEDVGGDGQPTLPRRCCLGFLGNACGIPDQQLIYSVTPATDCRMYEGHVALWPAGLIKAVSYAPVYGGPESETWTGSSVQEQLVCINDDQEISDQERERALAAEFTKIDVQVEFTD